MDKAKYDDLKKEWTLENIKDEQLTLEEIDAKQSLCISQCQDTFVRVTGKVSHILLINCKKVGVVFDSVVASFEVMRCNSVEIQVSNVRLTFERFSNLTLCLIFACLKKN